MGDQEGFYTGFGVSFHSLGTYGDDEEEEEEEKEKEEKEKEEKEEGLRVRL